MQKLYVYADFDWLSTAVLVGKLNYETVRGNDSYAFLFDKLNSTHKCNLSVRPFVMVAKLAKKYSRGV